MAATCQCASEKVILLNGKAVRDHPDSVDED